SSPTLVTIASTISVVEMFSKLCTSNINAFSFLRTDLTIA
ncbi:23278_t:CDS:2, partial [Gigaspora rosea]